MVSVARSGYSKQEPEGSCCLENNIEEAGVTVALSDCSNPEPDGEEEPET